MNQQKRVVKLDEHGNELQDSAPSWSMVKDNVTGLIWEVKTDDGSIHDKGNAYDLNNAQDTFIAGLNAEKFGGFSDWHMPTTEELETLKNCRIRYLLNDPYITEPEKCPPEWKPYKIPNDENANFWGFTKEPYYVWSIYKDPVLGYRFGFCIRTGRTEEVVPSRCLPVMAVRRFAAHS